jgi:heat shock protein HslJ
MKKLKFVCCIGIFSFCLACAGGAQSKIEPSPTPQSTPAATWTDVQGKNWILDEVDTVSTKIVMDRKKLAADNMADVYTLTFSDKRVAGKGAPNRFTGPYTRSNGNSLSICMLASTMMAALKEPDGLNEREFFSYLSKVKKWALKGEYLELTSAHEKDTATLVFSLKR